MVLEALAAGLDPLLVVRDDSRLSIEQRRRLDSALTRLSRRCVDTTPTIFRSLTTTESPQGILAVLPLPTPVVPPTPQPGDLVLIADAIQDPGNLGTILRTAAGAAVRWVWTTPGTVDAYAPKVVRSAMGAHFRLSIMVEVTWPDLRAHLSPHLPIFGATSHAGQPYDAIDWRRGGAIVIGNEALGLAEAARLAVDTLITIPLAGGVESLNAATAAAVILFEAARQRRRASDLSPA